MPGTKQSRTPNKKKVAARRGWGQLEGTKARVFRPSPDVAASLDELVSLSGRTQSAVIDESLRRAFWNERRYMDMLVRNFGGPRVFAFAYLMARAACGIEHLMQGRADKEISIAAQIQKATTALSSMHDIEMRDANGRLFAAGELKNTHRSKHVRSEDTEPWESVLTAIDRNLQADGEEFWWPLGDVADGQSLELHPQLPLRPSLEDLRAVWNWSAPAR